MQYSRLKSQIERIWEQDNLKVLRRYAATCAKTLKANGYRVTARPRILAAKDTCYLGPGIGAHCHNCHTEGHTFGDICIQNDFLKFGRFEQVKGIVEHEVAHLYARGHGARFKSALKVLSG